MAQATINVRIDAGLKARVDDVFRSEGVSTTQAVKRLWEEIARNRRVPEFITSPARQAEDERKQRQQGLLDRLAGIAGKNAMRITDDELERLYSDGMTADYLSLK